MFGFHFFFLVFNVRFVLFFCIGSNCQMNDMPSKRDKSSSMLTINDDNDDDDASDLCVRSLLFWNSTKTDMPVETVDDKSEKRAAYSFSSCSSHDLRIERKRRGSTSDDVLVKRCSGQRVLA